MLRKVGGGGRDKGKKWRYFMERRGQTNKRVRKRPYAVEAGKAGKRESGEG